MTKPKFSMRLRALWVCDYMEAEGLTCTDACARARIPMASFLPMLKRPKHRDLKERYETIKASRAQPDPNPWGGKMDYSRWGR